MLACLAGCAVRAPAAIDVDTLLRARGPVEARRELEIRVTGDRRDVAGRLALATLAERLHRPSEAIAALEEVIALGGPLGVRWHDEDRARLARLIAARGRVRLARGAQTAHADLARARALGAVVTDDELRQARAAGAIAVLRHSDAETRASGRRTLAALVADPAAGAVAEQVWVGARPDATAAQRGALGAWLWAQGAKRAAWDELAAWSAATRAPRDPALQEAYLVAARWWLPLDRPGPAAAELVGVGRCAFGGCVPREVVGSEVLERAYLAAPVPPPVREPTDVAALVSITLHQTLRGEAAWGPAIAARVELAAFVEPAELARLPAFAQPMIARLVGRRVAAPSAGDTPSQRLVIAAVRVLDGASSTDLGDDAVYAAALRRIAASAGGMAAGGMAAGGTAAGGTAAGGTAAGGMAAVTPGEARAVAAARHAAVTLGVSLEDPDGEVLGLRAIAAAFLRDPEIADRLGREAVACAPDAAVMHATLGALFDGLGDPARVRAAWQAAVDASAEPAFERGLAEAQARQGDGDAALITATAAAAASGDPAVVWAAVARGLVASGRDVHALDAARSAIDLAGPETLAGALDAAIRASRALGRDAQAARLAAQRARLVGGAAPRDGDPTDVEAALAAYQAQASDAALARLWVASRWSPRDVAVRVALRAAITDPARAQAVRDELVELAGDRDPEVRRAAVAALR